ncbi:Endonuclease/exonuclease/phosphatase [Mycena maculata]|uniref:Endonuclease/exonuclease/phosphatase n=1 Tax=Mycena maculata TaxID=230809 RepID=A0AAD7JU78_9AGAR|nr:Endonuclease/exonuclease/phosphatase [Mycena maculata]
MSFSATLSRFMASTSMRLPNATPSTLYRFDASKRSWSLERIETEASVSVSFSDPDALFSIVSWNVDFAAPFVLRRFQSALSHLEKLLSPHLDSPPPSTIILLQEVHSSCFQPLLSNAFIREFYQVTDIARHSYSTVTLVPRTLASLISFVSRVPFTSNTKMHRDCLYVDFDIPLPPHPDSEPKKIRLRIANTHLESLNGFGDTARPKQLGAIAKLLTASGIDGGLVAGDMNSISPSDLDLPERLDLTDAWLVGLQNTDSNQGVDETETGESEGHTWGYQPRCEFPPRRLDKILTKGKIGATGIQRVGVGLKVEGTDIWVSDHYGLAAKIIVQS